MAEINAVLRRRPLALAAALAAVLVIPGASNATTPSAAATAAAAKLVVGAAGQLGTAAQRAGAGHGSSGGQATGGGQPSTGATTGAHASGAAASHAARAKKPAAPPVPLSGWLAAGTTFPDRAVVLTAPPGSALSAGSLHVSENGLPVAKATLTPLSQPGRGDLGVMLVVDQSPTMAGGPLATAMSAIRGFAAQRRGRQQVGLITFDQTPSVLLHPTSDAKSINTVLAASPWTGTGADVPAATKLALSELAASKVALGAIVVISDGAGPLSSPQGPAPAAVEAAAAAARVPVYTVGLQDAHSSASALGALKAVSPGSQFVSASGSRLPSVLGEIESTLTRGYLLRYRSLQAAGHPVNLSITATGVTGSVQVGYRTPAPAPAPKPRPAAAQARPRHTGPDFSGSTLLSPVPAFAHQVQPLPAPAPTNTSFLGSSGAIPVIAGIAGVLLAIALSLVFYRPSHRAVRLRVGSYVPSALEGEAEGAIQIKARRVSRPGVFQRWWDPFVRDVEIARMTLTPPQLMKRSAMGGAVLGVLVFLISGSLMIAVVPLLLWPVVLKRFVTRAARKQREVFADTLPAYLQDLSSALRVGRSLASALEVVATSADEPVRSELERAVTDEALGRPLEESLEAVARRMDASDMDQVALIASLNRRSGSNVAEALERVADGARDRADLRREIKALTAQAKMSSWVLTGLPPLLLVAISLVSPQYAHPLLHTTIGIVLVIVGGLMVFGGWKVMKKITTIKA